MLDTARHSYRLSPPPPPLLPLLPPVVSQMFQISTTLTLFFWCCAGCLVCPSRVRGYTVYASMDNAMQRHPDVDVMVSFASLRSAFESTMEALNYAQVCYQCVSLLIIHHPPSLCYAVCLGNLGLPYHPC